MEWNAQYSIENPSHLILRGCRIRKCPCARLRTRAPLRRCSGLKQPARRRSPTSNSNRFSLARQNGFIQAAHSLISVRGSCNPQSICIRARYTAAARAFRRVICSQMRPYHSIWYYCTVCNARTSRPSAVKVPQIHVAVNLVRRPAPRPCTFT